MTTSQENYYLIKDIINQPPSYPRVRDILFSKYFVKNGYYATTTTMATTLKDTTEELPEIISQLEPMKNFSLFCSNLDEKSTLTTLYCVLLIAMWIMLVLIIYQLRILIRLEGSCMGRKRNGKSSNGSNSETEFTNEGLLSGHIPLQSIAVSSKGIPACTHS